VFLQLQSLMVSAPAAAGSVGVWSCGCSRRRHVLVQLRAVSAAAVIVGERSCSCRCRRVFLQLQSPTMYSCVGERSCSCSCRRRVLAQLEAVSAAAVVVGALSARGPAAAVADGVCGARVLA
jgi:hypothetical protein